MNQIIDNDIVATKEFHQRVSSLYKLGGRNRNIFAKVQSLLGGIKEEGEKAFNQFSVTNHGESRIKSCVKYDLGLGFRLVTVKRDRIIWLLYVGDHADTDKWITRNSGWTPVRASDGSIRTVRKLTNSEEHGMGGPVVPGSEKLVQRFEDQSYYEKFLGLLSSVLAIEIASLDGDTEESQIKRIAGQIIDKELQNTVVSVLISLLEDNRVQAQDLIDLHLGAAAEEEQWAGEDFIKIKRGDEIISVKENTTEYEEALNYLAQKGNSLDWLLFMHPEQSNVVDKNFAGPAQLSGVSGSGKTCVAIRRSLRLAETNPDAKLLFVTLNKSLVGLIKRLISLSAKTKNIENQIEIISMFELSQKLIINVGKRDIRLFGESTDRLNEDIDKVFREYYRQWLNNSDASVLLHVHKILTSNNINAEAYIREEFDWIRSALPISKRSEYLDLQRTGRKFPLQKDMRVEILKGLELWEKKMTDVGIIDYLGLAAEVHNFIDDLTPVYDHVLVDESQDFGTTELAIINAITKTGENDLFLCGDVAQSVLPKKRSLKEANIELTGGKEKIIKNYRNTRQILRLAYEIILNNLSEDQFLGADGALEILDPEYANRSLNEPVLLKANSLSEELTYAKKMLEDLCYQNVHHNGCIVLAGFKNSEVKNYSEKVGIPVLDGNLDPLNEPLVISDLEQAKGYEFDTVVIVNCEKGVLPADGVPEDEVYRSACQFYVSMTRAKNDLYLSYHKTPSPWLENTKHLYRTDWSEIESLSDVNLLEIPERLAETQYADRNQDLYTEMTGLDFIYSEYAIGMTVEQQDRLINLVDGKGLFSSEKRAHIKWRDMRSLLNDILNDPNSRMVVGQTLLKTLADL
tara:strand:- start:967 stop:3540 length:2574 start_codon:yes stop_codon:yes gene_type:complete